MQAAHCFDVFHFNSWNYIHIRTSSYTTFGTYMLHLTQIIADVRVNIVKKKVIIENIVVKLLQQLTAFDDQKISIYINKELKDLTKLCIPHTSTRSHFIYVHSYVIVIYRPLHPGCFLFYFPEHT